MRALPKRRLMNSRDPQPRTFRPEELLELSHRGLQRALIPGWLKQRLPLSDLIASSAYGETPSAVVELLLEALGVTDGVRFVDLGCGGGTVCAAAYARGAAVLGIERNPELWDAARQIYAELLGPRLELLCVDFLQCDWGCAQLAYTTTTAFPHPVLGALAQRVERSNLQAIACLGRPLPLSPTWAHHTLGAHPVIWNPGEPPLQETAHLYRRAP